METREILLKADKVNVAFERLNGGKIRVGTSSWDNYISIYYLPSGSYGGAGNGLTNVTYDSAYGDLFVPHYGGDNTVWPVLAAVPGEASGTTRYIFPAWQSLADNGESFGGQIAIFEALQGGECHVSCGWSRHLRTVTPKRPPNKEIRRPLRCGN